MKRISDRANDLICVGLVLLEVATALLFKYDIAYGLAARHDDSSIFYPLAILAGSILFHLGLRILYAFKHREADWLLFFSVSLIPWAFALLVIGRHTPCCLGG